MAIPDVFVIGGGPAGLATAIAARQKGMIAVVADALRPPVDKACGEGLLPDGLPAARQIGLELAAGDCFHIRGIRQKSGGACIESAFPAGPGWGIRRTVLHNALVELAMACGVELQWGRSIGDLKEIRARWIVGADGLSSQVRSCAQLDSSVRNDRRFGFRMHFRIAPWTDFVEIHWSDGCQIYVTPVADDEVGVALISGDSKLRVREALQRFPELEARLRSADSSSSERGGVTSIRKLRRVVRGNVALVGDASGSVDAITGQGLGLGFHHALALADAMARDDLSLYEAAHRRLARRPRFMADLLLTMDRWPSVRRLAFPFMQAYPRVFEHLLAMHVGVPMRITRSLFRPA